MIKKISIICTIFILLSVATTCAFGILDMENVIPDTAEFICNAVPNPTFGSVGGEWTVLTLAVSDENIPGEYYEKYYENLEKYVKDCNGVLHKRKYTEYSRVVITLTAIGKNPENVAGFNLVKPLTDFKNVTKQGLNGPIWALIALDSCDYGDEDIRKKYLDYIAERELDGGGFALTANETEIDIDVTAMALVALSKYSSDANIKAIINRGVNVLSSKQTENGGYESYGIECVESAAQVLAAISTLKISYNDPRFVKNGNSIVDNILMFYKEGKGFSHIKNSDTDIMATEQAVYALVAANRLEKGKTALFDLSENLPKNKSKRLQRAIRNRFYLVNIEG